MLIEKLHGFGTEEAQEKRKDRILGKKNVLIIGILSLVSFIKKHILFSNCVFSLYFAVLDSASLTLHSSRRDLMNYN